MSPHPRMSRAPAHRRRLRRALLAGLALGALASPAIASGCAASFTPGSVVEGLRIFAVQVDRPYANPGDDVTFSMTFHDGLVSADQGARPVQIVWLGGCFNPPGDQYFGCYEQIAELFGSVSGGQPPSSEYIAGGIGLTDFTLRIPDDILANRPPIETGTQYGLAYVFFAACAGQLGVVQDPGGRAGSFPLGCFDNEGRRLGAESFVPGYTQVYVFADGRTNANPEISGLTLDDEPISEDFGEIPTVKACPIPEEDRAQTGCGAPDIATDCQSYLIKGIVDPAVAEIDPDAQTLDGEQLTEVVWINYFADQGDLSGDVKQVNEAQNGFNADFEAEWLPPSEPGVATLWAVLRDARGGSSVVRRQVRVEE